MINIMDEEFVVPRWTKKLAIAGAVMGAMCVPLFLVMLIDGRPTEMMAGIFLILVYSALFCILASIITTIFLLVKFIIKDMWNEYKDDTKWYIHDTIREELEEFGEEMRDYIDYALELKEQKSECDEKLF